MTFVRYLCGLSAIAATGGCGFTEQINLKNATLIITLACRQRRGETLSELKRHSGGHG